MIVFPDDILALAQAIIERNQRSGQKVAVAESCTGGLLSASLTEISGSSAVFDRGFVTYSDEAKVASLGVSSDILETFGSVSVAVAWAMARGALEHSQADISVAVSGIAGPAGGSEQKPVGTVVFAVARRDDDPEKVVAEQYQFANNGRSAIRMEAVRVALQLLLVASEIKVEDAA